METLGKLLNGLVDALQRIGLRREDTGLLFLAIFLLLAVYLSLHVPWSPEALGVPLLPATFLVLLVLTTLIVLWRLAFQRSPEEPKIEASTTIRAPGGKTLLGIYMTREWIRYGVVKVSTAEGTASLSPQDIDKLAEGEPIQTPGNDESLYSDLVRAVGEMLKRVVDEQKVGPVEAIGLGVPGQIDPVAGRLLGSPGVLESRQPVTQNLANKLLDHLGHDRVMKAFGISRKQQFERLIYLDNDVRCAARYLSILHTDDRDWVNYACILVGQGVGSGLILNRKLYYGSHFCSGEIGHATQHLDEDLEDPEFFNGRTLKASGCRCGMAGVHWELLINDRGLLNIAQTVNPDRWQQLGSILHPSSDAMALTHQDFTKAARIASGSLSDPNLISALRDKEMSAYLDTVLNRYSFFLGVGLANLTTVLDLDHIELGGEVISGLWTIASFRGRVEQHLQDRAFKKPELSECTAGARDDWSWRGAALIPWDQGYASYRRKQ